MNRVGLWVREPISLLISNNISKNFINLKDNTELIKDLPIVIIDDSFTQEDQEKYLNHFNKVIILVNNSTISITRAFFKNHKLYDLISRRDIIELEQILENFYEEEIKYLRITNSVSISLIKIKDIAYISYDRIQRHCILTLFDEKTYLSKISMGDLEKKLNYNFIRIERSYIINKTKVISLNFRDETLIFSNNLALNIGRRTLKKLEKNIFNDVHALDL